MRQHKNDVSHFGTESEIRFLGSQVVVLFYFGEMFWKENRNMLGNMFISASCPVSCQLLDNIHTFPRILLGTAKNTLIEKDSKKDSCQQDQGDVQIHPLLTTPQSQIPPQKELRTR